MAAASWAHIWSYSASVSAIAGPSWPRQFVERQRNPLRAVGFDHRRAARSPPTPTHRPSRPSGLGGRVRSLVPRWRRANLDRSSSRLPSPPASRSPTGSRPPWRTAARPACSQAAAASVIEPEPGPAHIRPELISGGSVAKFIAEVLSKIIDTGDSRPTHSRGVTERAAGRSATGDAELGQDISISRGCRGCTASDVGRLRPRRRPVRRRPNDAGNGTPNGPTKPAAKASTSAAVRGPSTRVWSASVRRVTNLLTSSRSGVVLRSRPGWDSARSRVDPRNAQPVVTAVNRLSAATIAMASRHRRVLPPPPHVTVARPYNTKPGRHLKRAVKNAPVGYRVLRRENDQRNRHFDITGRAVKTDEASHLGRLVPGRQHGRVAGAHDDDVADARQVRAGSPARTCPVAMACSRLYTSAQPSAPRSRWPARRPPRRARCAGSAPVARRRPPALPRPSARVEVEVDTSRPPRR